MKNKLIIAAAGSGKTTWLVNRALTQTQGRVLITTFTQANAVEIINKIIELNRAVPDHITVQTWFSFLLQHGVKPYQGKILPDKIRGLLFMNAQSVQYVKEADTKKHYFTENLKIYSDKLSKFVVKSNMANTGAVMERLSRIYTHVFVDEVQDLAGNDLEVLQLLFSIDSEILLVGDPRQVTYQTHPEKLHSKYRHGAIKQFIIDKKLSCEIDETTLNKSHRNNAPICLFSSNLYPQMTASEPSDCLKCRNNPPEHAGVFLVKETDLKEYQRIYKPVVLRPQLPAEGEWTYGLSKGLGFDRVLIYPTNPILRYLKNGKLIKTSKGKTVDAFDIAKFYVALTRAGIAMLDRGVVSDEFNREIAELERDYMRNSIFAGFARAIHGPGVRGSLSVDKQVRTDVHVLVNQADASDLSLGFIQKGVPHQIIQLRYHTDTKAVQVQLPRKIDMKVDAEISGLLEVCSNIHGIKTTEITSKLLPLAVFLFGFISTPKGPNAFFARNPYAVFQFSPELIEGFAVKLQIDSTQGVGDQHPVISNITNDFKIDYHRVHAKIAFNYLAKLHGSVFIQNECFNNIRSWILKGGDNDFVGMKQDKQMAIQQIVQKLPQSAHAVIICYAQNQIFAYVVICGFWGNFIVLTQTAPIILQMNMRGLVCDWKNRSEFDLTQLFA